jgi:Na+/H+ antiporter NhaC
VTDYGFLSVVPPLLTVVLALWTRDVLLALIAGILCGSLIITGSNPSMRS